MRYQFKIPFFVLLCSTFLCGNDTLVTLGAGGLVPIKSSQIVMESEDLQISVHQIKVRYVFRNTTDKDIEAPVAFPLPDLNGGDVYNAFINLPSETHLNFVQFAVSSDGKPVATQVEARAFDGDKEITPRLKAAGLPVNVLLEPLNTSLMKLPESNRRKLEKVGLIVPDDFNPPLRSAGKRGWWATWTMRVQYYWTQSFPANSTVELVQTYRPVVGGSYIIASDDGKSSVKPYCGTTATLQRIAAVKKRHPVKNEYGTVLLERQINYILTTANNWKGPIRHFRLSVSTDSPDDILLTCTLGLKRVSSTRYELVRHDFHPSSELKLLILQPSNETPN